MQNFKNVKNKLFIRKEIIDTPTMPNENTLGLKMSPNKIYHHVFTIITNGKGYNAGEVDNFLDEIILDYNKFDFIHNQLSKDLAEAHRMNDELKKQLSGYMHKNTALEERHNDFQENNYNNLDILKRVAKLEEIVFKNR